MTDKNPLLDFSDLPRFGAIRPEHIAPAIESLLAEARGVVAALESESVRPTWDDFVRPLDVVNEQLSRAWGVVGHLHAVLDSPELREAYNTTQPAVVQFYTELGQNLLLYEKYKKLKGSAEFMALSVPQRKVIENEIRDFRLAGAELPAEDKVRLARIQEEQAQLATRFSENVLDSTNAFCIYVKEPGQLKGIPEDALESARESAAKEGVEGWKFTLQAPSYIAVIQHADSRQFREAVYRGYVTRASDQFAAALEYKGSFEGFEPKDKVEDPARWDNGPVIERILALRHESANLLGFSNYAELSLVPKMADSPSQVLEFLEGLAEKALPFARNDFKELLAFARDELKLDPLQPWDVPWASEKLRASRYSFSEQEVKQYFPEPKVLEGLFGLVERLYGIQVEPDRAETWDPSVRFFRIRDAADDSSAMRGRFYLDAYARDTKRGGAWMDEVITRQRNENGLQTPVAYLVCNFSPPVGDKPALLAHDDVLTLFHEFGHGLHHLLSQVDQLGVSGIRGVEWDAVELPSQFMENFCWEWEVLSKMTARTVGGATPQPLPRELYEKMIAAKNFQSGLQMVRQLEFALFDMRLHTNFLPGGSHWMDVLEEIRAKVSVLPSAPFNRFANSFSHVFSGGAYAAGYYSYKWAEVLSADAFSAFEENRDGSHGVLDPVTGKRFLTEILSVGGSRPAMESFKAFRGREPSVEALLRHSGMIPA